MDNILKMCEAHKLWVETAGKKGVQLSLDETDMRSTKLTAPMLEQSFFSECNFSEMTFEGIDFYQSELYSCDFTNAHFLSCDFRKSTLDYSDFSGATFTGCKFPRTDAFKTNFSRCTFKNCSFVGFNIMEGNLNDAKCEATDFDEAYLDKVCLGNFSLKGSKNLDKANHVSFYLSEASMLVEGTAATSWLTAHNK